MAANSFTADRVLLRTGFIAAIILSFICLGFCFYYLVEYQRQADATMTAILKASDNSAISERQQWAIQLASWSQMFSSKVLLQSCGVVAGIAFGFLGFALFLIGIDGQIGADLSGPAGVKISATALAPGAFIMLLATILVGMSSVSRIPIKMDTEEKPGAAIGSPPNAIPAIDNHEPNQNDELGNVGPHG